MPNWVKEIVEEHMRPNYRVVDLAQDLKNKTAKNVRHLAVQCQWHERMEVLSRIVQYYGSNGRTIVFTSTKNDANDLAQCSEIAHLVEAMHGDISQPQRERTLKRFKENRFPVLVATDVASRGIHIPDIELVI